MLIFFLARRKQGDQLNAQVRTGDINEKPSLPKFFCNHNIV